MTSEKRAVIFTGGHCEAALLLPEDLSGDLIIAADSGWLTAKACGITPSVIAGDFDSSPIPDIPDAEIIRVPAEKDDTDTMLACNLAIGRGVNSLSIIGGTGGRTDHTFSNVFFLENLQSRGVKATITDGANRIRILHNEICTLPASHFFYFSLFSLERSTVTVRGCKYPLTNAVLTRDNPFAVSNEITGNAAEIQVSGAPVLLIESGAQ